MESIRHKPVAFWKLDDATPFQDYSGYSRSGTLTGTESRGLALTADSNHSLKFSTNNYATFASPVFLQGMESAPFSISATIFVIGTGTEQNILSHDGVFDGLTVEGNTIYFSTSYTNTGVARCSYNIEVNKKLDVVGVHIATKNSLYINGVLVDEVDITPEQAADTYVSSSTSLYSGKATSGIAVMVNGVGLYAHALQPENISSIYRANNRRAEGVVPGMFSGDELYVSSLVRPPSISMSWSEDSDWEAGTHTQTVADGGQLVPQMTSGLTVAGKWIDSVDIYSGETPTLINSMNLFWYGEGETVEVSLDGESWTPAVKGSNLSIIPVGFDPTEKELYVRVTFAAGLEYAYVDSLQVRGYHSDSVEWGNRLFTYTAPIVVGEEYDPLEMRDDWGVNIDTGGSLTIGPNTYTDSPTPVNTVEVWYKINTGTLTHNLTVTDTYVNGVLNGTAGVGEWVVAHYTVPAGVPGDIILSGAVQVGRVAAYDSVLSATEISDIVANYTGVKNIDVSDNGSISIAESTTPVVIYAHDWEIVAS